MTKRILVIDDEAGIRSLLLRFLAEMATVVTAASIEEGREEYAPGKFALVISDKNCPTANAGIVFLNELVEKHNQAVLLMSDRLGEGWHGEFMSKPFLRADVIAKVTKILGE